MKICKIIAKSNEDIVVLVKRDSELISITIDAMGNIDICDYDDDIALLEEIANLQLRSQQKERFSIEDYITDEKNESHFISNEEE